MSRLKDIYRTDIVPKLQEKFSFKSVEQVPKITKITINMGVGEAVGNKKALENAAVENSTVPAKPTRLKRLGLVLEQTEDGLTVMDVKPGSRAEKRGIRTGDVIVSVNGEEIASIRELREQIKSARKAGRKGALLQIQRQNGTVFVPIPLARG